MKPRWAVDDECYGKIWYIWRIKDRHLYLNPIAVLSQGDLFIISMNTITFNLLTKTVIPTRWSIDTFSLLTKTEEVGDWKIPVLSGSKFQYWIPNHNHRWGVAGGGNIIVPALAVFPRLGSCSGNRHRKSKAGFLKMFQKHLKYIFDIDRVCFNRIPNL